ncbi:hypothetical protein LCGC14_1337700 [marine sediment metagenome]|uniref:Uncharacterized protein n=1 Tax=marine sediment metagenome TaxID=412755 RepID=A0A0F9NGW5_9ZZZZ
MNIHETIEKIQSVIKMHQEFIEDKRHQIEGYEKEIKWQQDRLDRLQK